MQNIRKNNRPWFVSAGAAALLLSASAVYAAPRLTLTTHVPEAVANGQARRIGDLAGTERLNVSISLPLRDEGGLDELLGQLYDPQHANYRHFISVGEFTERFGPPQDQHDAVVHFAQSHELTVTATRANRMVIDLHGTAAAFGETFHLRMGIYQHPTEDRVFYAPDREPTLDLDVPVLHISGLDNFTLPHAHLVRASESQRATTRTTGSGPGGEFLGSDLRAAYYGSGTLTGAGQSVGLVEFGGYELSDVQRYFDVMKLPLNVPITGVSVQSAPLDCPRPKCDDSEQVLDIEMAISMAPGLSHVYVYVAPNAGATDVPLLAQMASDNTCKQLSSSWGWGDDEKSLDPIFKEFMAQGQTFLDATGDNGSRTKDSWPGDDIYVTGVGGTDLTTNGPGGSWKSETGWNGSAGGPNKNNIAIPSYQQLSGVINSSNMGSTSLRNMPDVAAQGNTVQYICYNGTCNGGWGGTSFAAPLWGGFMALVNQQAAANGGSPVGFLNPAVYQIGVGAKYTTDFHDIVSGKNGGYTDVAGYDLVTGWGSFNGQKLIDALAGAK